MRFYIVGITAGYFILWGYMANWDPHMMVFWEGNDPHIPSMFGGYAWWFTGPLLRVGVGFGLLVAALLSVISGETHG